MPSKKIRLRLYADENFPVPSSTFLKAKGISVVHAYDFGYINKSDKFHIKKAKELQRTLITIDRDFLYYSELTTNNGYGAIVVSTGNSVPIHINNVCHKALPKISPNFAKGSFIKITMNKIHRVKDGKIQELDLDPKNF